MHPHVRKRVIRVSRLGGFPIVCFNSSFDLFDLSTPALQFIETVLMHASERCPDPGVIQVLGENGANVRLRDSRGDTALMYAARADDPSASAVIRILLDAGAGINDQGSLRRTALMYAAEKNSDQVVIETLLRAGANAKLTDYAGMTAFDYANKNINIRDTPVYWLLNDARFQ